MGFITVKHKDGREAEITAGEVDFYKSIGFKPVPGSVIEDAGADGEETAPVATPVNGTDQRLDLLIDEIRGLRADIAATFVPFEIGELEGEPADGDTVELREPLPLAKSEPEKPASEPEAPKAPEPEKPATKPKK